MNGLRPESDPEVQQYIVERGLLLEMQGLVPRAAQAPIGGTEGICLVDPEAFVIRVPDGEEDHAADRRDRDPG